MEKEENYWKWLEWHLLLLFSVKFGSCFGLFDIAGKTQYIYIICKNKIKFHLLQNSSEKLSVSKACTNKLYIFRQYTYIN